MRRLLVSVAALAVAVTAAPAGAAPPVMAGTTCGYLATTDTTGIISQVPDTYTGVLFAVAAGVDVVHPTGNPAKTTITCDLLVNGSVAAGDTASEIVSDVPATFVFKLSQVVIGATDVVELCTTITSSDNAATPATNTYGPNCVNVTHITLPPAEVCDALDHPLGLPFALCDLQLNAGHPLLPLGVYAAVPGVVLK